MHSKICKFLKYCKTYSRVCWHLHSYYILISRENPQIFFYILSLRLLTKSNKLLYSHDIFLAASCNAICKHTRWTSKNVHIVQKSKIKHVILTFNVIQDVTEDKCMIIFKTFLFWTFTTVQHIVIIFNYNRIKPPCDLFNNQHFNHFLLRNTTRLLYIL